MNSSKLQEIMERKATIIKNPEIFEIDQTPDELVERRETSVLFEEVAIFLKYRSVHNLLLTGHPGTGKTVTANSIQEQIPKFSDEINSFLVNCKDLTPNEVLYNLNPTMPKNLSFNDAMFYFLKSLEKDTLVFLDEIDKGRNMGDLLYKLSRPKEICKDCDKKINLVLISNNPVWEDVLDAYIRSSLQLTRVIFSPYNKKDLIRIMKKRISKGFMDPAAISEEQLEKIADFVAEQRTGDSRVAILALKYSARLAERRLKDKIEEEDIQKAITESIRDIESFRIVSLSNQDLFALYSCFTTNPNLDALYDTCNNIAREITENKVKLPSKSTFFRELLYLETQGLIRKEIVVNTEGKTPHKETVIRPNVDKGIVDNEINLRIGKISENKRS